MAVPMSTFRSYGWLAGPLSLVACTASTEGLAQEEQLIIQVKDVEPGAALVVLSGVDGRLIASARTDGDRQVRFAPEDHGLVTVITDEPETGLLRSAVVSGAQHLRFGGQEERVLERSRRLTVRWPPLTQEVRVAEGAGSAACSMEYGPRTDTSVELTLSETCSGHSFVVTARGSAGDLERYALITVPAPEIELVEIQEWRPFEETVLRPLHAPEGMAPIAVSVRAGDSVVPAIFAPASAVSRLPISDDFEVLVDGAFADERRRLYFVRHPAKRAVDGSFEVDLDDPLPFATDMTVRGRAISWRWSSDRPGDALLRLTIDGGVWEVFAKTEDLPQLVLPDLRSWGHDRALLTSGAVIDVSSRPGGVARSTLVDLQIVEPGIHTHSLL